MATLNFKKVANVHTLTNGQFWELIDQCFGTLGQNPARQVKSTAVYEYSESNDWRLEISTKQNEYTLALYCKDICRVTIVRKTQGPMRTWPMSKFIFTVSVDGQLLDTFAVSGTVQAQKRWVSKEALQQVSAVLPNFIKRKIRS